MGKVDCWILIIVGTLIGTVFTFGMHYWNAPVTQAEAVRVTAVYESYELVYGHSRKHRSNSLNEIRLHFADHETLSIDSACVDDDLPASIAALPEGAVLQLLVHPNSDNILSLRAGDAELLHFDETVAALTGEMTGFLFLGLFMYAGAAVGAYYLLTGKTY